VVAYTTHKEEARYWRSQMTVLRRKVANGKENQSDTIKYMPEIRVLTCGY